MERIDPHSSPVLLPFRSNFFWGPQKKSSLGDGGRKRPPFLEQNRSKDLSAVQARLHLWWLGILSPSPRAAARKLLAGTARELRDLLSICSPGTTP